MLPERNISFWFLIWFVMNIELSES
jgi:hypothetical protein